MAISESRVFRPERGSTLPRPGPRVVCVDQAEYALFSLWHRAARHADSCGGDGVDWARKSGRTTSYVASSRRRLLRARWGHRLTDYPFQELFKFQSFIQLLLNFFSQ